MCGLFGVFSRENGADLYSAGEVALSRLSHRGPDDHGIEIFDIAAGRILLGHARLSIIDLSSGGHQPMYSRDGRYALLFNGEIYNYIDLRRELINSGWMFRSASDTEVLLASWCVWGKECLPKLIGMFSFVILDRQDETLTCVRDAFGIKPFFYSSLDQEFGFSSELPALIALCKGAPELNWQRSYDYLVHGDYDSCEGTFFRGVYHLLPGHMLEVSLRSPGRVKAEKWWAPQGKERTGLDFEHAVECVRESFLRSIRLHLRSDVPLGVALSGGVDSSAVACAMRYVEPDFDIHTFSYVARGNAGNEEAWVDLVNGHISAHAHKVEITGDELARDLDDMIRVQGEPFGSTSIYAQYRVYQLAQQSGVKVTLDGQGADEMLGGYDGYPGPRLRSLLETSGLAKTWRFLGNWASWPGRSRALGLKLLASELTTGELHQIFRRLNGRAMSPAWLRKDMLADADVRLRYPRQVPEISLPGRRLAAELAFSMQRRGLPSLLRHGDRNSMRFSVESRVPFLTLDQAEYTLSLPERFLVSENGETKSVFKAAMRGIVPDAILDRKDKIGFQTPEKQWIISIAGVVRRWLADDISLEFLDQGAMLKEFDAVIAGHKPFSWQVWRWINFIRWYQQITAWTHR